MKSHNITIKEIEDYVNKIFDIQSLEERREDTTAMLDYEIMLERQLFNIGALNFLTHVN